MVDSNLGLLDKVDLTIPGRRDKDLQGMYPQYMYPQYIK